MIRKARNQYSYNGYELEQKYSEWVTDIRGINGEADKSYEIMLLDWMSITEKGEYDFCMKVESPLRYVFIDVVGAYEKGGAVHLYTSHKDYNKKLELLSEPDEGYLAFLLNGLWRFIRISDSLPAGDIRMTPGRLKHVRSAETVFKCDAVLPFPEDLPEEDMKRIEDCKDMDDMCIVLYLDENGKNRADVIKTPPITAIITKDNPNSCRSKDRKISQREYINDRDVDTSAPHCK